MKLGSGAKGVYVIAPTPFHPDGRIDDDFTIIKRLHRRPNCAWVVGDIT